MGKRSCNLWANPRRDEPINFDPAPMTCHDGEFGMVSGFGVFGFCPQPFAAQRPQKGEGLCGVGTDGTISKRWALNHLPI